MRNPRRISSIIVVAVLAGVVVWTSRKTSDENLQTPQAVSRQEVRPSPRGNDAPMPPSAASEFVESEKPTLIFQGEDLDSWVHDLVVRNGSDVDAPVDVTMPDGKKFRLAVKPDPAGNGIMGEVLAPSPGNFTFVTRPSTGSVSFGVLVAKDGSYAYHTERVAGDKVALVATTLSKVVCATDDGLGMPHPPGQSPQEIPIPEDHPDTSNNIPDSQNGIISLQSNPGAPAVVYLDFDGQSGPHNGWGDFEAEHSGLNNTQIKEIWQWVAEAFVTFSINVTTDVSVFDAATNK
ncbi:MAG: hypothetical protein EOP85_22535, partial [Verrucomicrobiaceae bacterium]